MKRFLLLLLVGVAAAVGIWFAMRSGGLRTSAASVTALLPKGTLALVHVPDVNGARAKWRETDLYKLWREPEVQDFLQKPLSKAPQAGAVRQRLQQIDALQMKDAFLAIVAWENNQPKMLGGFRFKGSADDAERVIGEWRTRAQEKAPAIKRETVTYEKHTIEIARQDAISIATVYDGSWFFAANDLPALKTLLDRADGRLNDAASTLTSDPIYTAAFKHMPMNYSVLAFGRLEEYFARLAATLPPDQKAGDTGALLRQVKCLAAASSFQSGRIRDVLFVNMPQVQETGDLTRSSLSLATAESFLYFASFLHLPHQMPATPATAANGFPAAMQGMMSAFAAKGITLDTWKNAFGAEFGIVGDWPQNARLPALFATLPVKDAAKAREIMSTITTAPTDEGAWQTSEKDGVQYFTRPPANPMVPIGPTVGLSDKLLVAGLDQASVETAIRRAGANSGLAGSQAFKNAESLVPAPKNAFGYVDTALFYSRLDAALRPMLIMAAAFAPNISETVDLGKLPQPEVITRHLSPIVMSQNYQSDGYVTESVGPMSIYQAAVGIAAATGAAAALYHHEMLRAMTGLPSSSPNTAAAAPPPVPEPDETPDPDETPTPEPSETPES